MRIAVIGAGAVGSVIAAQLALAGRSVVLVARGQMLERLKDGRLCLEGDGRQEHIRVEASDAQSLNAPIDLAICCVKTPDLASALLPLALALDEDGAVLMVQNGVEAEGLRVRHVGVFTFPALWLHQRRPRPKP